jgi:hypothetical protein
LVSDPDFCAMLRAAPPHALRFDAGMTPSNTA